MKNKIVCPAKCNGGYAEMIKFVSQHEVGIKREIARAAKLSPNEGVSTCLYCGCVWRETFHPDLRVSRMEPEILGTDKGVRFEPETWLEKVLADFDKESEKL